MNEEIITTISRHRPGALTPLYLEGKPIRPVFARVKAKELTRSNGFLICSVRQVALSESSQMSALNAAVTLGNASGWSLSNLQIQKMLYIAQMKHLGEYEIPIFNDDFEAWKLGPVIPSLYRQAKIYGSKPVRSLFCDRELPDSTGKVMVEKVFKELPDHSAWKLVAITHWDKGAWAKNYKGDGRGDIISKNDILNEYGSRAVVA